MKFIEVQHVNPKNEILKFPDHYVGMAVTVSDAGVAANTEGKKIVKAGTIVGGGTLMNSANPVAKLNTVGAEGVLMDDVDVTYGPKAGTMIIHGFIAQDKLPEVPSADAKGALKQITFVK